MKKLKLNSKWAAAVISAIVVSALSLGLGIYIYRTYRLPQSRVQVTGEIVDNGYNNFISDSDPVNDTSNLVRVGDKLYYNYYGNYASYGLYEISSNGAKRIHWDGHGPWAFLIGHSYKLYPIREYGGNLLMNTIVDVNYYVYRNNTKEWELAQGRMQTYREETQSFDEAMLFGNISDIHALTYQETSFGFVYESSEMFDLWVYSEENGSERISAEAVYSFYTVGEQIYYLTHATTKDPYVLHMFDWGKKIDTVVCQWTDFTYMTHFIVEKNNLIFMARNPIQNTQSVYTFDLSNLNQKEKAIYTIGDMNSNNEYIYSWNVWDATVYLCTQKGLIAVDLDTGIHRVLCDKIALECDIVDDTWVYFIEIDNHDLWRVDQNGMNAELVLGS